MRLAYVDMQHTATCRAASRGALNLQDPMPTTVHVGVGSSGHTRPPIEKTVAAAAPEVPTAQEMRCIYAVAPASGSPTMAAPRLSMSHTAHAQETAHNASGTVATAVCESKTSGTCHQHRIAQTRHTDASRTGVLASVGKRCQGPCRHRLPGYPTLQSGGSRLGIDPVAAPDPRRDARAGGCRQWAGPVPRRWRRHGPPRMEAGHWKHQNRGSSGNNLVQMEIDSTGRACL